MTNERVKKYLLGKLSESEASRFEEEYSLNDSLFEDIQLGEAELIDEYLAYQLTASERKLFEKNYLITPKRLEKVETARIFHAALHQKTANEEPAESGKIAALLENQLLWRFALAGLVFLLIVGIFIFVIEIRKPENEVALVENYEQLQVKTGDTKIDADNKRQPVPVDNQNTEPPKNVQLRKNEALRTETSKPEQAVKSISPKENKTKDFVLLPETLRSEGEQFIEVSKRSVKVDLKLKLPDQAEEYDSYQVTLKNADGETILKQTDLKSPKITLPSEKLQKQTYVIFLEGKKAKNALESIAEFTFRVRR